MEFPIEQVKSAIESAGFTFAYKQFRAPRFEEPPLEVIVGATVGQSSFSVRYGLQHNLLLFNQYDIVSEEQEYCMVGSDVEALRIKKNYLESCMDQFFCRLHPLDGKSPAAKK